MFSMTWRKMDRKLCKLLKRFFEDFMATDHNIKGVIYLLDKHKKYLEEKLKQEE